MRNFILLFGLSFLLAACGQDDSTTATDTMPEKADQAMKVVDHTLDEAEFELRRSINGWERIIESYQEQGVDTSEAEEEKSKLEKELLELLTSKE
ncbi:MAG: hypothetical protein GWO08_21340 [Gammaproteobacteria bacterium]|nr:hypothetical protein [Gammaproteobacteria bacterium]NIN62814.1 hypothetical protein [Gammaproteobacteria bacterium]NIO63795.1 hypothetical protein [Gammaproteobacteria bacterium]NIP50173.1 hypothetical protein [Gammaproteobacteria bacterium]NIQ12391.1 hypothetical protein [Gammaproteobacteria bacterium]